MTDDDEVVFFVEPSNRNGDPVVLTVSPSHNGENRSSPWNDHNVGGWCHDVIINQVEEVANKAKGKLILFNPDLELFGTLGIRERDRRHNFVDSFQPAFTFICLVRNLPFNPANLDGFLTKCKG